MDKLNERKTVSPVGSSPRASLGYGEDRIPQNNFQFLSGKAGEKSERFTLPSWPFCICCHGPGGCVFNPHKQFTHGFRQGLSRYW